MSRGTLECLGVVGSRCLGSSGSPIRLSDPFPITTSSLPCSDSTSQLQPQFHQGASGVRCGVRTSGKGGHRDRTSFSGVLQSPLCHSQSHRGLAACHRPLMPQWLGGTLQFSYGDCPVRSPVSPSGGLDGVPGSPGRLPPGSCTSGISPVPEVFAWGMRCFNFRPCASACLPLLRCSPASWLLYLPSCIATVFVFSGI